MTGASGSLAGQQGPASVARLASAPGLGAESAVPSITSVWYHDGAGAVWRRIAAAPH